MPKYAPSLGKQLVFFSCHPSDFDLYFQKIAREILEAQDCAVFYRDPGAVYEKNELSDLFQEVQLLVFPITFMLLSDETSVFTTDLTIASDKHIPVLPLLLESVPDDVIAEKLGSRHYIRREGNYNEQTYKEKLKKYLGEVLADEHLQEKVRSSFAAHFFMSYRKSDRKYALQLMRQIHNCQNFRDVAIWYDEFLSPGEDFNDAIISAIDRSKVFVIAVTPNLISEKNYVMEIEYPYAAKIGKPILAAELEETEYEKLQESYNGFPNFINAYDERRLNEALNNAVGNENLMQASDPKHDYYIGLAYLSGIDVEVDHERGMALITSAAERGCEDAVQKLITVYGYGVGTAIDKAKEIEWKKKLVALYQDEYIRTSNQQHLMKVQSAVCRLADQYFFSGDIEQGVETIKSLLQSFEEQALDAISRSDFDTGSFEYALLEEGFHIWIAELQTSLGNMLSASHRYDEAERNFIESNDRLFKMKKGCSEEKFRFVDVLKDKFNTDLNTSVGINHDIGQNLALLGHIETERKNHLEALEYYKLEKLVIYQCIHVMGEQEELLIRLCEALVGEAWSEFSISGNETRGITEIVDALSILKSLYAQHFEDQQYQEHLGKQLLLLITESHQRLAIIEFSRTNYAQAYEYITISIALNSYLYESGMHLIQRNIDNDHRVLRQIEQRMLECGMNVEPINFDIRQIMKDWIHTDFISPKAQPSSPAPQEKPSVSQQKTAQDVLRILQKVHRAVKSDRLLFPSGTDKRVVNAIQSYASTIRPEDVIAVEDRGKTGLFSSKTVGFLFTDKALYSSFFSGRSSLSYNDIKAVSLYDDGLRFTLTNGESIFADFGRSNDLVLAAVSALCSSSNN